jgi:hypothetical protein
MMIALKPVISGFSSHRTYIRTLACIACVVVFSGTLRADDFQEREYRIKAGFLFNFTKFVDWPAPYALRELKEVNICIVGTNPFSPASEAIFKAAAGVSPHLNLITNDAWKGKFCHIMFISNTGSASIDSVLSGLSQKPVLTISEVPGFAQKGGVMEFVDEDNKVRLIVNMQAANALGLKIDAQLLEIAKTVIGANAT